MRSGIEIICDEMNHIHNYNRDIQFLILDLWQELVNIGLGRVLGGVYYIVYEDGNEYWTS